MTFDPEVAKDIGTDAAIILSNIEFWQATNKANRRNYHDGNYWTYNTVSAFSELFYYLKEHRIRRILDKLEEKEYIISGNYNSSSYDRTKWYCSIRQMDLADLPNGVGISDETIPDNKPDIINTDNKQKRAETKVSSIEVFDPVDVKDEFNKTLVISEKEKVAQKRNGFSIEIENCYDNCLKFFPESVKPKTKKQQGSWMDEIRKLNEIDKIPFDGIEYIVEKVREDDFWSKNFLSITKLRKKNKEDIPYIVVFYEKFKPKENKNEKRISTLNEKLNDRLRRIDQKQNQQR